MEAVKIADKLTGLQAGRLVNFVTKNGYVRPLLVLIAWQDLNDPKETGKLSGKVNGVVFRDGSNDDAEFPSGLLRGLPDVPASGNVLIPPPSVRLAEWATSVEYSEDHIPGTWHWPPKGESTIVFVTQDQLSGLLQTFDEQIEVKIKRWLADFKEQEFDDAHAVEEVEGLPIEIQEINDLRDSVAKIQKVLEHHGLNGPAEVAPEQAALSGEGFAPPIGAAGGFTTMPSAETATISAPTTADSIVQTPGHPPQSGQVAIGDKSKGGNDGELNAAALANK